VSAAAAANTERQSSVRMYDSQTWLTDEAMTSRWM
jgi:hypothetical protein